MFCTECGAKSVGAGKFCAHCGTKLVLPDAVTTNELAYTSCSEEIRHTTEVKPLPDSEDIYTFKNSSPKYSESEINDIIHQASETTDLIAAADLWRIAAEWGNAEAQCHLARCYINGNGVEKDYTEAVKWCHRAAEQGNSDAQLLLGIRYYKGEGVKKDLDRAVIWYQKAIEQGNTRAKTLLGVIEVQAALTDWKALNAKSKCVDLLLQRVRLHFDFGELSRNFFESLNVSTQMEITPAQSEMIEAMIGNLAEQKETVTKIAELDSTEFIEDEGYSYSEITEEIQMLEEKIKHLDELPSVVNNLIFKEKLRKEFWEEIKDLSAFDNVADFGKNAGKAFLNIAFKIVRDSANDFANEQNKI